MSIADIEFIEKNSFLAQERTRTLSMMATNPNKLMRMDGNVCFAGSGLRVGDHYVKGNRLHATELVADRMSIVGTGDISELEVKRFDTGVALENIVAVSSLQTGTTFHKDVEIEKEARTNELVVQHNNSHHGPLQDQHPNGFWCTGGTDDGNNGEDAEIDACYGLVQNLPLRRFAWRNLCAEDRRQLGWKASEVATHLPHSVDENGVLDPDQILLSLMGALKKMMAMTDQLSDKVSSLEQWAMSQQQ